MCLLDDLREFFRRISPKNAEADIIQGDMSFGFLEEIRSKISQIFSRNSHQGMALQIDKVY